MPKHNNYKRLTNMELKSTQDLRLKESEPFIPSAHEDQNTTSDRLSNILRCVALAAVFCAFGIGMYKLGAANPFTRACFDQTTYHSPFADSIDLNYHETNFDVPLFTNSIFVRQPSPEVDAAWDEISYKPGGLVSLSLSEMLASGYSADYARLPSTSGDNDGGENFMVGFEVFHLLHCLNFLRKASYINVDYYRSPEILNATEGPFRDPEGLIRPHLNHCIEALRQTLMCRASAGIFAHKHVKNFSRILPAFVHPVKCADFEAMREEALRRQLAHRVSDKPLPEDRIWEEPTPLDHLEGRVEGWSKEGWYLGP